MLNAKMNAVNADLTVEYIESYEAAIKELSNNDTKLLLLDWVLLLGGNNNERFYENPKYIIGDYWSGRDGYFDDHKLAEKMSEECICTRNYYTIDATDLAAMSMTCKEFTRIFSV